MEKLEINDFMSSQLEKMSRWAQFLSYFGFVCITFLVIGSLGYLADEFFLSLVALLLNIFLFFICFYLYDFSKKTKQALLLSESRFLEIGLESLAKFFHFLGIYALIIIAQVVLSIFMIY